MQLTECKYIESISRRIIAVKYFLNLNTLKVFREKLFRELERGKSEKNLHELKFILKFRT